MQSKNSGATAAGSADELEEDDAEAHANAENANETGAPSSP
jgi:hypothetical protein